MADLERIFEDCLQRVAAGEITPEQCVQAHPEHAEELRRLFAARRTLAEGRRIEASRTMKARGRARLMQHMQENPRVRPGFLDRLFPRPLRTAGAVAGLLLAFLVTGTAMAQTALPGDPLYPWKRWSERAWLAAAPNPAAAQRRLLQRRAHELIAVQGDTDLATEARQRYEETVAQVRESETGLELYELDQLLDEHRARFEDSGIAPPLPGPGSTDPIPSVSPTPLPQPDELVTPPTTDPLDELLPTETPILDLKLDG